MSTTTPTSLFGMAAALLDPPETDPALSAQTRMGIRLWSAQRNIMRSVWENRRTAVPSCHDSGKSYVAACCAAEWIAGHLPGEAVVVSTAPRWQQIRAILWKEINRLHKAGHLPGRVNQTEWWLGNEIVGFGRKPADYDETGFQGVHARYVLAIIDEAGGVPRSLWDSVDTIITNDDSRVLAIGNPDISGTAFEEVCRADSDWNVIRITADDTPNFSGESVSDHVAKSLLSKLWVKEKLKAWGATDPRYISKVLAEFPKDNEAGVIPWSWLQSCRVDPRPEHINQEDECDDVALGVDVGGGGDRTVIRERRGMSCQREWDQRTPKPEEVTNLVMLAIRTTGARLVNVDSVGIGWAVCGSVRQAIRDDPSLNGRVLVQEINAGSSPTDKEKYALLRDELWWNTRELFEERMIDMVNVKLDDAVVEELINPLWAPNNKGQIKVEAKEVTISRLGHSPDHADAFNLAYWTKKKKSKKVSSM